MKRTSETQNSTPAKRHCGVSSADQLRADIAALCLFHGAMPDPDETNLKVMDRCLRPFFQQANADGIRRRAVASALRRAQEHSSHKVKVTEEEWAAMHTRELERLVFEGAILDFPPHHRNSDLKVLRQCLHTFVQTMQENRRSMLAFKRCMDCVPTGHALRGISTHGEHPIQCIESFLLPWTPQARRTLEELGSF